MIRYSRIDPLNGPAACPVHGVPMCTDSVPIVYGLPLITQEFSRAQADLFPCANTSRGGGCLVQQEAQATVRYCPRCREEKKAWLDVHGAEL